MPGKWSGGVVEGADGDGPPTVDTWHRIDAGETLTRTDATESVAYRTTITDPRTTRDERAVLELHGVGPRAEVWIDGDRVASRDGGIGPLRREIDPDPEAELAVVRAPSSLAAGEDDVAATVADPPTVSLAARPPTFLRRLTAQPRLGDDGETGTIDVELEVDADVAVEDAITVSVRPVGFRGGATMQRIPVTVEAGDRTAVTEAIEIREPSLWWPRGYGPQHRYEVQAKLGADAVTATVGFRTISATDGLAINGRRIRARGLTRLPGSDPAADVERAVGANATLVRTRGHVPGPAFFDACDEAGVLGWVDLPAIGGAAASSERYRDLGADLAAAYGHRPSLAVYGICEGQAAPVDGLHGSGFLTRVRFRYRTWRTETDEPSVAPLVDRLSTRRAVAARTGPPGTDPDAAAIFPGWRYLEATDLEWLCDRVPSLDRVVGAFGAGSLASDDADPATVPGLDATALEHRVGSDVDADATQAYQARTVATVAETLRRREADVTVAETLRDVHPDGGPGLLTTDDEPKPAYRALARAFEPVQAVLDGPAAPGEVGITLCNDTHDALEGTVTWSAGDADGETTVAVDPLATTAAGTATIPADAERVELSVTAGDRTATNSYAL